MFYSRAFYISISFKNPFSLYQFKLIRNIENSCVELNELFTLFLFRNSLKFHKLSNLLLRPVSETSYDSQIHNHSLCICFVFSLLEVSRVPMLKFSLSFSFVSWQNTVIWLLCAWTFVVFERLVLIPAWGARFSPVSSAGFRVT